jgi:hypothetical protein
MASRLLLWLLLATLAPACAGCAGGAGGRSASPAGTAATASSGHHARRHVARHRRAVRRHAHRQPHRARRRGVPAVDVPDRRLTPGAALTASAARVCVSGYAASVRDVPESEKDVVYARYGVAHVPYGHEVDHLVSLELGGSNTIVNLWPEPYAGRWGARTKDVLEDRLHDLVCGGRLRLAYAQRIEARDWVSAYRRYVGGTPPAPVSGGSAGGGGGGGGGSGKCTPGYSPCLVDRGGDYDCSGGGGNGPYFTVPGVVYAVTGPDPYLLDGNHDGRAC